MLLASWPLQDFAGFLQIISWITLPVLFIAVIATMLIHYYQRRVRHRQERVLHNISVTEPRKEKSSFQQARYRALKKDFDALQQLYLANEEELASLSSEMKRQDDVIDQLRDDIVSLEKSLSNLRLALTLKEEQLSEMQFQISTSIPH